MLSPDRVEQIFALRAAGKSTYVIAEQLGHSRNTIRDYLDGRKTPGKPVAWRTDPLTDALADYCRRRLAEDSHLRPNHLFKELTDLGFHGSRSTFYRALNRHDLAPTDHRRSQPRKKTSRDSGGKSRPTIRPAKHMPVLPRPVSPITGEALSSYLTRLAHANHLTVAAVLAVLPSWFSTKVNSGDDRVQHHMLIPAARTALHVLAHLASMEPTSLARAIPAFGAADDHGPLRATTACRRCAARRGIHQPIPVQVPVHHTVCTRHGMWLSDADQPHLDVAACPEIVTAQYRVNSLLRRYTPHQLRFAYQDAVRAIPAWPPSPADLPMHWRRRMLVLQTTNHRQGTPTEHDAYEQAAIYPDAIRLAAANLNPAACRTSQS